MLSRRQIESVRSGQPEILAELDRMGLLSAPGESANDFAARLELLNANLRKLENGLSADGYEVEGIRVKSSQRIPVDLFRAPGDATEKLYGFRCEWVPGFFINPKFSVLFGGTAFYFLPDFFAMFIIRGSFRKKRKWLWYQRDELLAHELCHVARMAMGSQIFEEHFAYQTAVSHFRRAVGGIFHSEIDVFAFIGSTLLLLMWQCLRAFMMPQWPAWPGWMPLSLTIVALLARHLRDATQFKQAQAKLGKHYGDTEKGRMALFRCTDAEIRRLATANDITSIIKELESKELRWKALAYRFARGQ